MGHWPRKRSSKQYARVRTWADSDEAKPLAFAGYKVGMTHLMGVDNREDSTTAGEEIPWPVTVLECPPLKIASVRVYEEKGGQERVAGEYFVGKDKHLSRKLPTPDQTQEDEVEDLNPGEYSDISIVVHTQPGKTNIGKKRPEIFEVRLGGNNGEKLGFIKEKIGKDIRVSEIFSEGDMTDTHSVSKGKGTQGPLKRHGIGLKPHKSEKGRRRPGTLGGWKAQQHFMYRVAQAGQTGYQQRTQHNIQIFKIGDDPDEINVEGGFKKYGNVENEYVLVKGSVPGSRKRLVIFSEAVRPNEKPALPDITYISTKSKQGR